MSQTVHYIQFIWITTIPDTSRLIDEVSEVRPIPENSNDEHKKSSSSKKVSPNLPNHELYKDNSGCYEIMNLKNIENLLQQIAVFIKCQGPLSIATGTRNGHSVSIMIKFIQCVVLIFLERIHPASQVGKNTRSTYMQCVHFGPLVEERSQLIHSVVLWICLNLPLSIITWSN